MSTRKNSSVNTESLFFELLRVAAGLTHQLSTTPTAAQWRGIYDICARQSLVGVGFAAMQRLPEEQWPPRALVLPWAGVANKISQHNQLANSECAAICRQLESSGFDCLILKGQSNLKYYPEWLAGRRVPGDIDILIRRHGASGKANIIKCVDYCLSQARLSGMPRPRVYYHHADLPWRGHIEVEAHYRATWLNSPFANMRLQRWLADGRQWVMHELATAEGAINVPSTGFDAVYQLLHIYKHLFENGIGLRQVFDYYFVLRALERESSDAADARETTMRLLRRFGLRKFAGAMMWVLDTVLGDGGNGSGADDACPKRKRKPWMLCEPDGKEGRFLLDEIMMAGNFGKYDTRLSQRKSQPGRALERMKRNTRFIARYPEEALCKPLFMVYHWLWRNFKLWKRVG